MPLLDHIKIKKPVKTEPVWKGPEDNGHQGGITFSALSRWLSCRERFRLYAIEGLKQIDKFDHKIFFGNCWHAAEERYAKFDAKDELEAMKAVMVDLQEYATRSARHYRFDQQEVAKWYEICKRQFPYYVEFWKRHPEVVQRTPIAQELTFKVPYTLPSGRIVYLRGKMDGVDLIGGKTPGIYLFETKTKGNVDELMVQNQMVQDMQTLMYLVAIELVKKFGATGKGDSKLYKNTNPTKGVRFNVVKRPLSGGKGLITKHKAKVVKEVLSKRTGKVLHAGSTTPAETDEHYYNRVAEYIKEEPETYFYRWSVQVSDKDIERFKHCTLNPILEQLCQWYEWVVKGKDPFGTYGYSGGNGPHWVSPKGYRDATGSGYDTEYDNYLQSGSMVGLTKVDNLLT